MKRATKNKYKDQFPVLYNIIKWIVLFRRNRIRWKFDEKELCRLNNAVKTNVNQSRIYYLGICSSSNLGDMAQFYCIKKWIENSYPQRQLLMFESDTVLYKKWGIYGGFLKLLKKIYKDDDIIVFQSGYTTTDLGGNHDEMHRAVIKSIPSARILMMPQTILFVKEENRIKTASIYNSAKNMLFLARDRVSYNMALEMFPNVHVLQYPDIVTSLIGSLHFLSLRNGVCICCRNDGERFYSDKDIDDLRMKILSNNIRCEITDTTLRINPLDLRTNIEEYLKREVKKYSSYKVIITDRYHGTILSLVANTPVIVIKTNDHKVVTGVEWFKGIYDDYVFYADNLDVAFKRAMFVIDNSIETSKELKPYFKEMYYDKLKKIIDNI